MKSVIARVIVVLVAVVLMGGPAAASAQEPATGFVVLPADGLVLDVDTKKGTFTAVNGTTQTLVVDVTAVLLAGDGAPVGVALSPTGSVELAEGASMPITITGSDDASGIVVLTASSSQGERMAVIELPVTTATGGAAPPQPAVTAWDVTNGTWASGGGWESRTLASIPLAKRCDPEWEGANTVLAGTSGSVNAAVSCGGDVLSVTYLSETIEPGVYKARIELGQATVDVTLTQQRPVLLAVGLAILGLIAVLAANAEVKIGGPLRRQKERLGIARTKVEEARDSVSDSMPEGAIRDAVGALEPDSKREMNAIDEYRQPWYRRYLVVLPDSEIAKLKGAVAAREKDAGVLGDVADALADLELARFQLDDTSPLRVQADGYFGTRGWAYRGAETLAAVKGLTAAAMTRMALAQLRDEFELFAQLPFDGVEIQILLDARQRLEILDAEIAQSSSVTALVDGGMAETLRSLRATAVALRASADRLRVGGMPGYGAQQAIISNLGATAPQGAFFSIPDVVGALSKLPKGLTSLFSKSAPWLLFLVAVVVAFSAGLAAFYVDKPWGTSFDYLAAFIFGATTLAAALSLGSFFGERATPSD